MQQPYIWRKIGFQKEEAIADFLKGLKGSIRLCPFGQVVRPTIKKNKKFMTTFPDASKDFMKTSHTIQFGRGKNLKEKFSCKA